MKMKGPFIIVATDVCVCVCVHTVVAGMGTVLLKCALSIDTVVTAKEAHGTYILLPLC